MIALSKNANRRLSEVRAHTPSLAGHVDDLMRGATSSNERADLQVQSATGSDMLGTVDVDRGPIGRGEFLGQAVDDDPRLADIPELRAALDLGRLFAVADAAGITARRAEKIAEVLNSPEAISDESLEALVNRRALRVREARALGVARVVFLLSNDSEALTSKMAGRDLAELLSMRPAAWKDALEGARSSFPDGHDINTWASELARRHAVLAPSQALHGRLLAALDDEDALSLKRLAASWPGFKLAPLVSASDREVATSAREMRSRLALVRKLHEVLPGIEWLDLDYSHQSDDLEELALGTWFTADEQAALLKSLKAHQRVYAVAGDVDTSIHLLEGGYHSALAIARAKKTEIVEKTTLPPDVVERVHTAATEILGISANVAIGLHDVQTGIFDKLAAGSVGPGVKDYLAKIDGYAKLFGSQTWCECELCNSILGPAAYFVDLMKFVDEHVRDDLFTKQHKDHVLDLKVRRPDLWSLPLTCDNTNKIIPSLDIVNEILEAFVAKQVTPVYSGSMADRAAVTRHVYEKLDGAITVHAFDQPGSLPYERVTRLLAQAGHTRADLAHIYDADAATGQLVLSPRSRDIVFTPNIDQKALANLFDTPKSGKIGSVDVQAFLRTTGLTREELDELVSSWFVRGTDKPQIKAEKASPESVQFDVERLHGLTVGVLDRLHRFIRLARGTALRIPVLDFWLRELALPDLSVDDGDLIGRLLAIRSTLGLSLEDTLAISLRLPMSASDPESKSLFDRRFNEGLLLMEGEYLPLPENAFVHPLFLEQKQSDAMLPRLCAGLGVGEEDLSRLIIALSVALGVEDDSKGFKLNLGNLSLLYRHARLASALQVSVAQLFQLAEMVDELEHPWITQVSELETLLRFVHAWRRGGRSLDAIALCVGGKVLDPDAWPAPDKISHQIRDEGADAFRFADTVFAAPLDLTEAQSKAVVSANLEFFESDGDMWRLRADFSLGSQLIVPQGVPVEPDALMEVVRPYHLSKLLPDRVARALQIEGSKASALLRVASADLEDEQLVGAVRGDGSDEALLSLMDELLGLYVLFSPAEFDGDALEFVAEAPHIFALTDLPAVPTRSVWLTDLYARFSRAPKVAFGEAHTVLPRPDLHQLLQSFDLESGFPATMDEVLAGALQAEVGLVATLRASTPKADSALASLERLAEAVGLARSLAVAGDSLAALLSNNYTELSKAADAVEAGFRSRPEEEPVAVQLEAVEDSLRAWKRDVLCSFLLRHNPADAPAVPWKTRSELYQYFLLDVEMGGCGRTSRVASAISSVQLYVHRVRMNLERDMKGAVHVSPDLVPSDEWGWRQNFRLWEANRKVFLWPENYMDPDLRDDKTFLFKELEATLFQQDVTPEAARGAYASYIAGFEELAGLAIGGSWYESSPSLDRLHMCGVTSSDPPVWYYRCVDNLCRSRRESSASVQWGNWNKIEAQIPVRDVAPIVYEGRLHIFWVEIHTRSRSSFKSGTSSFNGYDHVMKLKYITLKPDETWSAAQEVSLEGWPLWHNNKRMAAGVVRDNFYYTGGVVHDEPQDGYTIQGRSWSRVVLDIYKPGPVEAEKPGGTAGGTERRVIVTLRNFRIQAEVDFFEGRARAFSATALTSSGQLLNVPSLKWTENAGVYVGTVSQHRCLPNAAFAALSDERTRQFATDENKLLNKANPPLTFPAQGLYQHKVGSVQDGAEIAPISRSAGACEDAVIQFKGDSLLFLGSSVDKYGAQVLRLGTTLARRLSRELFHGGVERILERDFQASLREEGLPLGFSSSPAIKAEPAKGGVEGAKALFGGSMGAWFREILLHIPLRIALHLHALGRHAAAQEWFHYIYDPTATGTGVDRVWIHVGFRAMDIPSLRKILSDEAAISAYRHDPFNPYAIARLRPTAFQKFVVMRYLDNLLDWADSLFAEFTAESIDEARMLYVLAADILGERPAKLGKCGGEGVQRKYSQLAQAMSEKDDFLVEIQGYLSSAKDKKAKGAVSALGAPLGVILKAADGNRALGKRERGFDAFSIRHEAPVSPFLSRLSARAGQAKGDGVNSTGAASLPESVVRQVSAVFCVPPNKELLAYWGRVEDRLWKIRTCRDIHGVSKRPALFAPEIDPRLLARAKALGLSLDEVTGATSGSLPPYRFSFLIGKARDAAAAVAGLGSSLLAALEKRDMEQLNRLRLVHQQNLARMTTSARRWEIKAAEEALSSVQNQLDSARHRQRRFGELVTKRTIREEEQQVKHSENSMWKQGIAAVWQFSASAGSLIPQIGSPFAMTFGGAQIGGFFSAGAGVYSAQAGAQASKAAMSGLASHFNRRLEEWSFQAETARFDIASLERQVRVAELRLEIAVNSLSAHEESISQTEEVFEFLGSRFTSGGLYSWLVTTLQRAYREAYGHALYFARLADEAYRYERGGGAAKISPSHWDAPKAGLLAGERLLAEIQMLERSFIETNFRGHEVDQAFSLQQIAPGALIALRRNGVCEFDVPELFFDLAYPGHYRRRVKAVRLTIPCITGPYVNIAAVLSLVQSRIRSEVDGALVDYPVRRSVTVATSTAQNDAGVFELNFRDERYLPFEGAGAVGRWRLELPAAFRSFDYESISDVVLSIAYVSEYDGALREKVENANWEFEQGILKVLQTNPLARVLRLRHDFSREFNRVLHSEAGTPVQFEIGDAHFPFFVAGRPLVVDKAYLGMDRLSGDDVSGVALAVDGELLQFSAVPMLGGMPGAALPPKFGKSLRGIHTVTVLDGGCLTPTESLPGDSSALDDAILRDIVLYVEYRVDS
ncbi:MAG: hypothetical protein H6711_33465 [Myxococcales bacterium]|nr:hypothetical protein [Myxococcales bacterium]